MPQHVIVRCPQCGGYRLQGQPPCDAAQRVICARKVDAHERFVGGLREQAKEPSDPARAAADEAVGNAITRRRT